MPEPVQVDVLQFMSLRQAATVDEDAEHRDFIRDVGGSRQETSLMSVAALRHASDFASDVVREVFCTDDPTDRELVQQVLDTWTRTISVACEDPDGVQPGDVLQPGLDALDELALAHRFDDGTFRILPDRLMTTLPQADAKLLSRVRKLLLDAARPPPRAAEAVPAAPAVAPEETLDLDKLVKSIEKLLQGQLQTFVFSGGEFSATFRQRKRVLFDALYKLYILRRVIAVDLQEIMDGLATLHTLEWLAVDRFLADAAARLGSLSADETALLSWLESWLPELQPDGLVANKAPSLVASRPALLRLLEATPVVHPIFAQLHSFRRPVNPIRPLGIGDLKVVKQWLVEYLPGEISHIANVLKGESNKRSTHKLEKTEDVFSFTGQTSQETSTDTQTTDHLELKREVESTVKSDLQLKADASLSVKPNQMVQIGASAGFAFSRSAQDASKVAQQFAHDVVSKAVSRLQTTSSQTRTMTKTFESEETVKHGVDNTQDGATHINGFYRFVDKRYMAQLYNFGKRLMFEFIVPEPAGFLVESRLRAFEGGTEVPTKPTKPELKKVDLGFTPQNITKNKWQELRITYDLSGVPPYPAESKTVQLVDRETRSSLFAKYDLQAGETKERWWATSYQVAVDAEGYEVVKLMPTGNLVFLGPSQAADSLKDYYFFALNGTRVMSPTEDADGFLYLLSPRNDITINAPIAIDGENVVLTFEAQNLRDFALTFELELKLSDQGKLDWQTQVYNAVRAKEQELVDAENREALIQYQSAIGDYYRALRDLEGTAVNTLLQGESSAANHRVIDIELRRHCLAELTKEFDADTSDDTISSLTTIGRWDVEVFFQKMKVNETKRRDGQTTTTFGWEPERHTAHYPATKLPEARRKGSMVQFLEQAFDWDNLSYLFYPYFWSTPPKWIDLMSRSDDADPVYTSFLQAGAARVLVSVTPGYEHAVMHYLATGQAWDGGVTPAIGDPLFIAIYQELRNQQDNLATATPEGDPWPFVLPTSLTYLDGGDPLPTFPQATPGQ
jgi:hypothetical protein